MVLCFYGTAGGRRDARARDGRAFWRARARHTRDWWFGTAAGERDERARRALFCERARHDTAFFGVRRRVRRRPRGCCAAPRWVAFIAVTARGGPADTRRRAPTTPRAAGHDGAERAGGRCGVENDGARRRREERRSTDLDHHDVVDVVPVDVEDARCAGDEPEPVRRRVEQVVDRPVRLRARETERPTARRGVHGQDIYIYI